MKLPKLSKIPELERGRTRIFNHAKASDLKAHRLSVYSMVVLKAEVFRPVAQEAAATTSRNFIEMQILRTYPRATDSEIPGVGSSTLV